MGDNGYPLDLLSPVRHVATKLDGAAPAALSIATMAESYRHPNSGDLARVKREQGFAGNHEAHAWLIGQAIAELGAQVEGDGDGGYRLARPFEKLRYPGAKHLHRRDDDHVRLRAPFDPMSGEFSENIRRTAVGDIEELRASMDTFGWLPEFPAIRDERGVVIVGHRRLAVAKELGLEPRITTIRFGSGDEADARRLRLAIASNVGAKPFTPGDRARIAEYLYGERDWTMARIAEALNVSQPTVTRDLIHVNKVRTGRPPKLTPEQDREAFEQHVENDVPVHVIAENLGVSDTPVREAIHREHGRRDERRAREAGLCRCPTCGTIHDSAPTPGN